MLSYRGILILMEPGGDHPLATMGNLEFRLSSLFFHIRMIRDYLFLSGGEIPEETGVFGKNHRLTGSLLVTFSVLACPAAVPICIVVRDT